MEKRVKELEAELETLQPHCNLVSAQLCDISSDLIVKEEEVEPVREEAEEEVVTFKFENYTEEFRVLINKMLSNNVAHNKIGGVIESCLKESKSFTDGKDHQKAEFRTSGTSSDADPSRDKKSYLLL